MSITDELREWFKDRIFMANGWQEIRDIADRIDTEHEKAMSRAGQLLDDAEKERDYNYAIWQDCKQKVLQHNITIDELSAEIERLKDELAHLIEPPKDADGEPIHIGDVMDNIVCPSVHREVMGVGVECFYGWDDGNGRYSQFDANCYCHHHAPTVEDVLREMADAVYADAPNAIRDRDHIVAEYASKLRLAGDDA